MTRAQCIARALRRGHGPSVVADIRRYFNVAKSARGFKWVYGDPLNVAVMLPTMREKTYAQLAREAGQ